MNQASQKEKEYDSRLLEIETLFRQKKPDIAGDLIRTLIESGFNPDGLESGLFKSLKAQLYYNCGEYKPAIKLASEAVKILASSVSHVRVGDALIILFKSYFAIGDLKTAQRQANDALAFYRRADYQLGIVESFNRLGQIAFARCDYPQAMELINEAIDACKGNNAQLVQLTGNLGRIEILNGHWPSAEENLKTAIDMADGLGLKISLARNYLSLGFLYIRMRQFILAGRTLQAAAKLIESEKLLREQVILTEYEGELALESGEIVKAEKILSQGYERARELAPDSSLVSQMGRRLAEAEYQLGNPEEALVLARKAYEVASNLGEKTEIGLAQMVIADIQAGRNDYQSALDAALEGLEILRKIGDPYDTARSLLVMADISVRSGEISRGGSEKYFEEAYRLFNSLKLHYWSAETRFRQGVYWCQHANISGGFKNLHEAEKIFESISEKARIRSVRLFLQDLSKKAVERSLSMDNEFKIFGNYFSDKEYRHLKSGQIDEIMEILIKRTGSGRVILYQTNKNDGYILSSVPLSEHQKRRFSQQFNELLGEEFSKEKPTLILDSRRDPFINELLAPDAGMAVSSVIVSPLFLGAEIGGYIYLDRQSSNGNLMPFGQKDLNFVVGFADLIALKLAEYDRMALEEDNRRLKAQLLEKAIFPNIITQNKQMLEMLARVQQVVNSNISISIEGETGCGKDLLAKTIHYNSDRKDRRFISVNCAALPETLLESELFGHKRGAFTGADRDKTGLFEEADGGTFFLDEIADMPPSIQAKVLRILEEKEIVRLGETRPIKVDVRIISATNRDLKVEMEGGRFRQDLYYRLTALCFRIPPLRERKEDIPLLIKHFAGENAGIVPDAMRLLVAFDWPGNVRELENEVKKLTLLAG
jgi:Nif-specific regulatory protein